MKVTMSARLFTYCKYLFMLITAFTFTLGFGGENDASGKVENTYENYLFLLSCCGYKEFDIPFCVTWSTLMTYPYAIYVYVYIYVHCAVRLPETRKRINMNRQIMRHNVN